MVQPFQQGVHLFLAAVAQGMQALEALWLFAQLGNGQFSHDNCCFFPSNEVLGTVADHSGLLHSPERKVVRCCVGEADATLFLVEGTVSAVVCWSRLRAQWLEEARRDADGLGSPPDFISLPRDEEGRPIIPMSRVTALVEAKEAWATDSELGTLNAATRSITRGQLVIPRIAAPSQQLSQRAPLRSTAPFGS